MICISIIQFTTVLTTVENVELPLLVSGISSKEARKLSEAKLDDVGLNGPLICQENYLVVKGKE